MSTFAVNRTTTPSIVATASPVAVEPRNPPLAPPPQGSSGETQSASPAYAPRRQDGQLRQARLESGRARPKREIASGNTGRLAVTEPKSPEFAQDSEAKRADEKLQQALTDWLLAGEMKSNPIPRHASVQPFLDVFNSAAQERQVRAWFKANGLDASSVRVFSDGVEGTVVVDGVKVQRRFTTTDGSGWNKVGAKLTEAANALSPKSAGVLLPDKKTGRLFDLGVVFMFYGVKLPPTDKDRTLLGQYRQSAGWPTITDSKRRLWHQQLEQLYQKTSDIDARSDVARQLLNLIKAARGQEVFNLGDQLVVVEPESTLAQNSQQSRERFAAWLSMPTFKTFIEKVGYGGTDQVYRVFEGALEVRDSKHQWISLEAFLKDEISKVRAGGGREEKSAIEVLDSGFKQLVDMCKSTGNTLYSRPMYDARQFLLFSGVESPDTPAQIYAAAGQLANNLPASSPRRTLPASRPENPDRQSVDRAFGQQLFNAVRNGSSLVNVPQGSSMAAALDAYRQVLAQPELQAWFESKGLEKEGLKLHKDSISGYINEKGVRTAVTFNTSDDSGWWPVSAKLRMVRDVLDPADAGIYYLEKNEAWVPTSVVAQAYGLPAPSRKDDWMHKVNQQHPAGLAMPADQYQRISSGVALARQRIGDLDERAYLADYLESQVKGEPDDKPWNGSEHSAQPSADSAMVTGDHFARERLQRFTESSTLHTRLEEHGVFWRGQPFRVSEGKLEHQAPNGKWLDVTRYLTGVRSLSAEFIRLVELSKASGNALYSVHAYDARQLVDQKGLGSPRTAGEARNVARWLRSALPPAPPLGNYSDLLEQPWAPGKLTSADKVTLKTEIDKRLTGKAPLQFDYLNNTSLQVLQQNPAEHLENLLGSAKALNLGDQLANVLNWHGSPVPDTVCQQLTVAALTLHAGQDVPAMPGHIAGYSLYKPENMGRTFDAVRRELEQHLQQKRGLDPKLAVLVAQIRLAQAAPEFLVRDVPKEIVIGTPAWAELRLGCEMAELGAPGTSRVMNETQVSDLTTLAPTHEAQATLMQLRGIRILLEWAVLNGVISAAVGGAHSPSAIKTASEAFFKQRKEVNDAMNAVTLLPSRRAFAIRELLKVFPGVTRSELEGMQVLMADPNARRNTSISEPRIRSIVETYMTGDLTPGKWVLRSDMPENLLRPRKSPFQQNLEIEAPTEKRAELDERIRKLPDLNPIVARAVKEHVAALKKAYATELKLMFTKLPLADRQLLNNPKSVVSLFSLRGETGLTPAKQAGVNLDRFRGRHGTLMRVELGKQVCYFEVFAGGKMVKRTDLPATLKLGDVLGGRRAPPSWRVRNPESYTKGFDLNVDFEAYSKGTSPRPNITSSVIVEQLGEPVRGEMSANDGAQSADRVDVFASEKIGRIAAQIAEKNLYESDESMTKRANEKLPLEEKREVLEHEKKILKGLIPFIGAYQEFADGNIGSGLFALGLDVLGVALGAGSQARSLLRSFKMLRPNPLSSAIGKLGNKVASLTPKIAWAEPVASLSDRAFNFTKDSALFANAVFNPASGYSDLVSSAIKGTLNLQHQATRKPTLTKIAANLLTVEEKARAFWMAGGFDPAPKPQQPNVAGTSQGVAVEAAKINNFWYAINPKTGQADGTPLPDFK